MDIIHPPKARTERWVQVGALSDPSAAARLQRTLVEKLQGKWPVTINKPAKNSQRPLHKVRIGPVEEGEDLEQLLLTLKQLKFDQPLLLAQHQL
ncbi:MAG: SPOR domain-containing protein [Saccharospirillaceae bacterium]|nr:SPOR domain-containing protein [Saccharospirillaceae bacterium]